MNTQPKNFQDLLAAAKADAYQSGYSEGFDAGYTAAANSDIDFDEYVGA